MIPAWLYQPIFLYTVLILTLIVCSNLNRQSYKRIQSNDGGFNRALILVIALALFIGMRPISGYYFGDMSTYAQEFRSLQHSYADSHDNAYGEWIWESFMQICAKVMDVSAFFTVVDLLYFGLTLYACRRLMPNNAMAALLFCLGALSCFTYGTNGIRNGVACACVLVMLTYIGGNKKDKCVAAFIIFLVLGTHKSTMLPVVMSIVSMYFIKSFKWAYVFWILSILVSLTVGNSVAMIFESLGFDDRMTSYLTSEEKEGVFTHTGFRWDFLIYSMMPIILGYYIVIKKGIKDRMYLLLLNTYTFSNAFWVMVIRASYSNRFAYLSWFMYPLVLAYPLFKLNVWGEMQGKRASQIMLAHVGFTWFMETFYW